MDRLTYRNIIQEKGLFETKTSGSTGVSVVTQKYKIQLDNITRHNFILMNWYDIKPTDKILKINPYTLPTINYEEDYDVLISWPEFFPKDLSRFSTVISYGSPWTGIGYDLYSSEEFGTIALQCPYNKENMHIMENLHIDFDDSLGLIITDMSHPYLKEYEIGDMAYKTECNCPIELPSMSHVKGRIRNLIKMPDGTSKWPILGLLDQHSIERFQVFQESIDTLRLHYKGKVDDSHIEIIRSSLGYKFNIKLIEGNFKEGKHEEFICEI